MRTKENSRLMVYMMIGLPASGKSTYAKKTYVNYPIVSRDLCNGSKKKEQAQLEGLLSDGVSVVVDDTNYCVKNRAEIILIAKKYGAEVIGTYVKVDKETALERNSKREKKVPASAIHLLYSKFEEPRKEE
ncbi:hypothetical protein FJZ53_05995, partial [Candidatus Woesearchaeota archaeon]|nr:hypothetical protein [Candidatus Woesearchaeota archaeon]